MYPRADEIEPSLSFGRVSVRSVARLRSRSEPNPHNPQPIHGYFPFSQEIDKLDSVSALVQLNPQIPQTAMAGFVKSRSRGWFITVTKTKQRR